LEVCEPFVALHSELVAPVRLPDGTEAVLKIPRADDTESADEAPALRFWGGRGAVRLLAHDSATRALLIERCVPGAALGTVYDDALLETAAELMQRLWRPPSGDVTWRRLEDEAARWLEELPAFYEAHGRPFERELLDAGLDALQTLGPTQEDVVVCHQDLHGGNILSAEREPWLAIDAKPIVAERAYDTVAIVRDRGSDWSLPLSLGDVKRRLDVLSRALELDRERMRLWGVAKHLAWGLEEHRVGEGDIDAARLLLAG